MLGWGFRVAALTALALSAGGCGARSPVKAATADVTALLAAARAADAQAFEAHLDRAAVRGDLREQIMGLARAEGLVVDGGPSDFALDRRISPHAFEFVALGGREPLAAPPTPAQVRLLLKPLDRSHVCVHDLTPKQACVLTFAREAAGWRLVGMPARPGVRIEVPPPPTKR
jgi:hypothetical protein